jgi:peptide/nickel transport system permease protein
MFLYILKRIFLMVPTFLAVSLILFLLLNLAPGDPAAQALASGDANSGQSSELSGQKRESYRLFKEQFNLDKPILFNTRYTLTTEDVREVLGTILQLDSAKGMGQRMDAYSTIEDWGWYAIPGLIALLTDADEEPSLRALASTRLISNSQRPLINPTNRRPNEAERAQNKLTALGNQQVVTWSFGTDATQERVQEVTYLWDEWHAVKAGSWDYTPGQKVSIFFGDTRFAKYWGNLARLDFGISHRDKEPVLRTVISKLKYSVTLGFCSVVLMYLISVPLGIWSAVRRNSLADRIVSAFLFMMYSLPSFFVGVVLLNSLSRGTPLQIFPTGGFESIDTSQMTILEYLVDVIWHLILPMFCTGYAGLAALSRYARTGLLDVIRSDYVRTARAKGLPEGVVIIKHAARNGMIPILTLLATLLPTIIGGGVVVETVFGIPGIGRFMFESIVGRDYNAVMAILLISCSLTLVGMLLSDISYAVVDPRISFD